MKNEKSVFLLYLILFPFVAFSQQDKSMITVDKNYSFENVKYESFRSMQDIFISDNASFDAFNKARRAQKSANVWGGISIAFIAGTSSIFFRNSSNSTDSENLGAALLALGSGFLGSVTGMIGIGQKIKSNKRKKQAIDVFNDRVIGFDGGQNQKEVEIVFVNGGIGLRF